jgi:hypothetical protein
MLLDYCNQMLWNVLDNLQVSILVSLSKENFYKHIKGMTLKFKIDVTTLAFGLRPRQRHGKMRAESVTWESHSHS